MISVGPTASKFRVYRKKQYVSKFLLYLTVIPYYHLVCYKEWKTVNLRTVSSIIFTI